MDWGNLILFWFISLAVLFILNFLLFRFSLIRKLITIGSGAILTLCGFEVNKLLKQYAYTSGVFGWDNSNIDTLLVVSVIMLIIVLLMSFGDSLLDFEDTTFYSSNVVRSFGLYFISISEETVPVSTFFTSYAISTGVAIAIYFVAIHLLKWFWIFGVLGCIVLTYEILLKPILLSLGS